MKYTCNYPIDDGRKHLPGDEIELDEATAAVFFALNPPLISVIEQAASEPKKKS
jgi:hypothetical protein